MDPFDRDQRLLNQTPLDNENILSGEFWGELRVFLAVAKTKSFNRAAELLGTSQPTVSRQAKRLQDVMGSQLFVPTKQGVRLTARGLALAQELAQLDHLLFALTSDLKGERNEAQGIVRVSITDGLNASFVAPAVRPFADNYPRIQLHLKSPANVISLRENQTDMMIGFIPADGADIVTRKLGFLHFIPVVAKGYVQRYGVPNQSNLEEHLFLQSEFYAARTGLWEPWNSIVARGHVAHVCDNSIAYAMLVRAELGIGLLGSYVVLDPSAVPLQLGVRISVPIYALALAERLRSLPVRIVFDWLCQLFGTGNPWFSEEFRLDNAPSKFDAGLKMLAHV